MPYSFNILQYWNVTPSGDTEDTEDRRMLLKLHRKKYKSVCCSPVSPWEQAYIEKWANTHTKDVFVTKRMECDDWMEYKGEKYNIHREWCNVVAFPPGVFDDFEKMMATIPTREYIVRVPCDEQADHDKYITAFNKLKEQINVEMIRASRQNESPRATYFFLMFDNQQDAIQFKLTA